jgi:hypothetical protein
MSARRILAPAALAALGLAGAVPGVAGAAWSGPQAATVEGVATAPSADLDAAGHLAVLYSRRIGNDRRVELRRGTLRSGLSGASTILQRGYLGADATSLRFDGTGGSLLAAWNLGPAGTRGARLNAKDRRVYSFPQVQKARRTEVVAGADGSRWLVVRDRDGLRVAPLTGSAAGDLATVPGVPPDAAVAVDTAGAVVVTWTLGGRVLAILAPAGHGFGVPQDLGSPGYARDARILATPDGHILIGWLSNSGAGNEVRVSSRSADGRFDGPQLVAPAQTGARAVTLTATADGAVLVSYVDSGVGRGWGSASGVLRAQVLETNGSLAGRALRLSGNGERVRGAGVGADPSGAFAVWSTRGSVRARRVAPGGILGSERLLSRHPSDGEVAPVVAGGPTGGAAAAWVYAGRVRVARER